MNQIVTICVPILLLGGFVFLIYWLIKKIDKPTTEPPAEKAGQEFRYDLDPAHW